MNNNLLNNRLNDILESLDFGIHNEIYNYGFNRSSLDINLTEQLQSIDLDNLYDDFDSRLIAEKTNNLARLNIDSIDNYLDYLDLVRIDNLYDFQSPIIMYYPISEELIFLNQLRLIRDKSQELIELIYYNNQNILAN